MKRYTANRLVKLCGFSVALVGTTCSIGYLCDAEGLYIWPHSYPMALPTALCMISIGLSLVTIAKMLCHNCEKGKP